MLHKLIVIPQSAVIKNAVIINHDRVIDAATSGETAGTHIFKFMHKTKSARPTDFANKRLAADIERRTRPTALRKTGWSKSMANVTRNPS